MIKRITIRVFYLMLLLGVLVMLGFVADTNSTVKCKGFLVKVDSPGGISFVDSSSVERQVIAGVGPIEGKPLDAVSLSRIEELINAIYFVDHSRVYRTIDGYIVAEINQRQPIARVINAYNESFYIDSKGRLMKTSSVYTARVPVVTGHLHTRYSPNVRIGELENDAQLTESEDLLVQLNRLLSFISNDDFLRAWIDQIYLNQQGEFELIPRNGVHTIEIGNTHDMEVKFEKLMKFYKYGLTQVGWGSYNRINLKFKNQIVCSK